MFLDFFSRSRRFFKIHFISYFLIITLAFSFPVHSKTKADTSQISRTLKVEFVSDTKPAIQVENETVSKKRYSKEFNKNLKNILKKQKSDSIDVKSVFQKALNKTTHDFLNRLVLEYHAEQSGLNVPEKYFKREWRKTRKQLAGGSSKRFRKQMKKAGKNIDRMKKNLREQLLVKNFLNEEVGKPEVSDEKIRSIYKSKKAMFKGYSYQKIYKFIKNKLIKRKKKIAVQNLINNLKQKTDYSINVRSSNSRSKNQLADES